MWLTYTNGVINTKEVHFKELDVHDLDIRIGRCMEANHMPASPKITYDYAVAAWDRGLDRYCTDAELLKIIKGDDEMTETEKTGTGNDKMMKISFTNVLDKGDRKYKLDFENVMTYDKCPREYLAGKPRMYYRSGDDRLLFTTDVTGLDAHYNRGELVDEATMNKIIDAAKACGERLYAIKNRIREDQKNWEGKTTTYYI